MKTPGLDSTSSPPAVPSESQVRRATGTIQEVEAGYTGRVNSDAEQDTRVSVAVARGREVTKGLKNQHPGIGPTW